MGVQQAMARRREDADRKRSMEMQVLSQIPMEELPPEEQEVVLRKKLELSGSEQRGPLGQLASRLLRRKQPGIEDHPVLQLFNKLQPRAPEGVQLESLPAPPDGAPAEEISEGGGAGMTGIEPMPVPVDPGAYPAAAAQAPRQPLKMTQASPGKARYGLYGPSYSQRQEDQAARQLAVEAQRGRAAAKERAAAATALRNAKLAEIEDLPPEMRNAARFAVTTGHMPAVPPVPARIPESALDTSQPVNLAHPSDPGKLVWSGSRRSAYDKMAKEGLVEWHAPQAPSTHAQDKEESIRRIMATTGMSRPQAELEHDKRVDRKERAAAAHVAASTANLDRTGREPSPGERSDAVDRENKILAAQKEARARAAKLTSRTSDEAMTFFRQNKRWPTAEDVRKEEQRFAREALKDAGIDPAEAQRVLGSVRSRLGPGGGPVPSGAARPNPAWTPR